MRTGEDITCRTVQFSAPRACAPTLSCPAAPQSGPVALPLVVIPVANVALHSHHASDGCAEPGQDLGIALSIHLSGRRHEPVGHADHQAWGIEEHDPLNHGIDDFPPDLLVRAQEDPQHVAAADYTHEPPLAVYDRQSLDAPVVHELGGGANARF